MGQKVTFKKRRIETKTETSAEDSAIVKNEPVDNPAAESLDNNADSSGITSGSGGVGVFLKKSGGGSARNARRKPLD